MFLCKLKEAWVNRTLNQVLWKGIKKLREQRILGILSNFIKVILSHLHSTQKVLTILRKSLVIRVSTQNVQKKKRNLVYIIKELNIIFTEKEATRELHFVVLLCIILMMDPVFSVIVSLYFQLKTQLTIFEALNMILIFLLAVQQEFQAT